MDYNIGHQYTPQNGEFYAEQDLHKIGFLVYHIDGGVQMIIDNVEVHDKQRLHGVGTQLVLNAAEYARTNKLMLKTHCDFAHRVMDIHPEFSQIYVRAA
jgi:predicted GNAT family acetyltransferase